MLARAQALEATIVQVRRDVHRHPELGFEEHRTAQLIADKLESLGVAVTTGVGKTGVVGDLGEGRPRVAIRADIDALPIQDAKEVPYASEVPGVMHACGHDAHIACCLGAAVLLAQEAEAGRLAGSVRFLFQPSEEGTDDEGLSGAMRMVDEGVMEGVDAVIGLHVWSELPLGKISLRAGPTTAYTDSFKLTVTGREAHGAFPHEGVDAITVSAQVIQALQTVVTRRLDPTRAKVLSIGTIHGGTVENVISGSVEMTGTLRTFEPETRAALFAELERACGLARALGGDYELAIKEGYVPIVNDAELTELVRQVGIDLLGADNVLVAEAEMGGEDFSCFAQKAPGCFFQLGCAMAEEPPRRHHHPLFDINEDCLPLGSALLAEAGLRALAKYRD
jgi:amidohydrolase